MTQPNRPFPGKLELCFESASIVAGECPSIQFPAIAFDKQEGPTPAGPQLQVTPASLEELREGLVGLITGEFVAGNDAPVAPRHIQLVVLPDEFEYLCGRVRGIRKHPLTFRFEADERGQLLGAQFDQGYPSRKRSSIPAGPLDLEIDKARA